ncbi:hypothetical protein [Natrinema sp. 1APR25-10V2]|uniref:hypothetical protein n=1 Tax=Natrinema sp. 1APR25-10V2 TaxID=2951081 RepID=UPI0028740879|nr:hypothetical protein [Natrinema sp. 1APR25-10V2]MDS0476819.1 hypothetical protein [Natrinema sp. 1APR25-10V2]
MRTDLISVAPFLLVIVIEAFSPLTAYYWEEELRSEACGIGTAGEVENLVDVLRYATDTVRMLTTSLVTIVAGIIELTPPTVYLVPMFVVLLLLSCIPFFYEHRRLPSKYATKGIRGYTPASLLIILINSIFIIAIFLG